MNVYFDWNIFDRIEKKHKLSEEERQPYNELERLASSGKIVVPYSNAHLNDLFRGFKKNPDFIDGHLDILERLTNNLCICQYWNKKNSDWHFRNVQEFFNEKKAEREFESQTFSELMDFDETGLSKKLLKILELTPLPKEFEQSYKFDPMFGIIYPTAKTQKNLLALCEDLYQFSINIKLDYSIYKSLKVFLIKSTQKLKQNKDLLKPLNINSKELPKHLNIFELLNKYEPKTKTSENPYYSKIIDTFYKYDLKGYKSDKNFNNMFDDALHTFYGAHCDYFITNDDRCQYKAIKTYERLNISTVVLKANEYKKIKPASNN